MAKAPQRSGATKSLRSPEISGEIKWHDLGNQDWSATAWGMSLTYAGARSGLFDWQRNSGRFSSTLTLSKSGLRPVSLWRESAVDRLAKWSGYSIELQTGDVSFDQRIYLGSDDRALIRHFAATPQLLRAIERVFDSGVGKLVISDSQLIATLTGSMERADVGDSTLTAIAVPLIALADIWPERRSLGKRGSSVLTVAAHLWWATVMGVAIAYAVFSGDEPEARQLEVFTGFDWQGVAAFCLLALLPPAVLGARRARSHRVLLWMAVLSLALALPLQHKLFEIGANQLGARAERLAAATIVDIRPDEDGLHRDGYDAVIQIEDQKTNWELSANEGQLAREGRLCVAAVEVEGLRTLLYVKAMKTWRCGQDEMREPLPPMDGEQR